MEKTLIGLVFIVLIAGVGTGYGLGYVVYQPQNQNFQEALNNLNDKIETINSTLTNTRSSVTSFQNELTTLSSEVANLNLTFGNIENKTWHFVMNFTTNETSKTSPNFFIQGQQWRIRWKLTGIEKQYPDPQDPDYQNITLVSIEWVREMGWKEEWTGFMVYDDSRFLMSILDIPMTQISYFANRYYAGHSGDIGFMAFDGDPNIKGVHYVFHGEREFYIEIKGMLTPVTLTVESYH